MTAHYLLSYDIREPRRLRRVHYQLKQRGLPIQYSVFLLQGHAAANDILTLLATIVAEEDDLRLYRIRGREALWMSGRETLRPPRKKTAAKSHAGRVGWFSRMFGKITRGRKG